MNELHRRAEALASEAGLAANTGRTEDAGRLFSAAADLEFRALAELPPDRVRTRSVLAVSAVSLLYKAGRLDEAEMACFRILGSGELNSWGQAELRRLLAGVGGSGVADTPVPIALQDLDAADPLRAMLGEVVEALRDAEKAVRRSEIERGNHHGSELAARLCNLHEALARLRAATEGGES
jgi:hypothetical protein